MTTYNRDLLKATSKLGRGVNLPSGTELMNRINEGIIEKAPTEYLEQVRVKVTEGCEEIIELGARIRPLVVDKKQIGWVRGVHHSERKLLQRWVFDSNDYIANILLLATSLKRPEIEALTALELRNITELIRSISEYDMSLFPYISAFVTTSTSESLWFARGTSLTAYNTRQVELPDGTTMKLIAPPDHARLWATLCSYREQSKKRLDDNWNALLILRPHAGKSADPLSSQLKSAARRLQTDTTEVWERVLRYEAEVDVNDGWAHAADDEKGMMREMQGMFNNDRHEQVMAQFEKQQVAEAEANFERIRNLVRERGGGGIHSETTVFETEAQVRARELALKRGIILPVANHDAAEVTTLPAEKIKRYL